MDVIDLDARRNAKEQPDPEFVKRDQFGRPMQLYTLGYGYDGKKWSVEVWAYSFDDAQGRVNGMRESLVLEGQLMAAIPL